MRAIEEAGYETPTPIQAQAIPKVLAGHNLVGIAQTGTGKTASFTLPMLHILASGRARARMPRSLILSPTRELATQTARNFETYGKHLGLSMALLIGGVGMGDQEKLLDKGVDVLIATPGRLLDWFERGKVLLGGVEILVIDEADRMFDMGFMPDVERIVNQLLKRKQTLLFSATMVPEVRRLADRFLRDPVEIRVQRKTSSAELVEDRVIEVAREKKRAALIALIRRHDVEKAIVFCNRKRDIAGVMRFLQQNRLNARDLHGDLEQVHRQATLDQFTSGTIDFLVATDVAARGLDISDMPVVINFDVPMNAEDYVHRIGRTGRAGRKGRAFTLVSGDDEKFLANVEKLVGRPVERLDLDVDARSAPRAPRGDERRRGQHGEARPVEDAAPEAAPAPAPEPARFREPKAAAVRSPAPPKPQPEPAPARSPRAARPARPAREPVRPAREKDEPVVGLGDHVPRFLLQPVPVRPASRSTRAE
ncbi:DEAD/DEAH box helicase [Geminicoccaceae bacterium 1502E]|nr:DEAD/DEAH box helicase [Geminicoccaceae bacterium 1502E]